MPGGFRVFLSHAEEDYALVRRVWSILFRLKVSPYVYERYPDYRKDIPAGIRDVLRDCVMCITFLTRDGIDSQWVQQELGLAYAFDKIIVPVVERGVVYKGFVQMIRNIPYQAKTPDEMISHIIYAVRTHVIQNYDKVEDGLALTCPNEHENDYSLPSIGRVNHAIKAGNVFVFKCVKCKTEIKVSPHTLETVP